MSKKPLEFVLHDGPAIFLARMAALVVVIAIALLTAWSVIAKVDEIAMARGVIEPVEQVRPVESRRGGRVAIIEVSLGEYVEEGELLVSLSRTDAEARRDEVVAQMAALGLEVERLDAQVDGRAPNFSQWQADYPLLVERETSALQSVRASLEAQRMEVRSRIAQREAEISSIAEKLPLLEEERAALERSRAALGDLRQRQLATEQQLNQEIQRLGDIMVRVRELRGAREQAIRSIEELQATLQRIDLDAIAQARARIAEAQSQVSALRAREMALEQEVADVDIRAPVAGFVQSLPDETTGDVIDPGGVVATIVPGSGTLRFSGRIAPRDIGFVHVGQSVRLKIDSYDFSRYGALEGTVAEISPTSTVDPRGESFYEVLITLERSYFRNAEDGFSLMPGMTGEADIVTGAKTVFHYVWKPVYTNLDLAMTER